MEIRPDQQLPPGDDTRCAARSAHGDGCTLTRGHEGLHERHFAGERMASWSELAEPPVLLCGQRDPNHPDGYACTLSPGHPRWMDDGDGDVWDHAHLNIDGEMVTGWNMPAVQNPPQQVPWNTLRTMDGPRPVRVRFIDLPPRYEERAVLSGITATVAVPGGFALVVDRFRDRVDCADQQPRWDGLGAKIGAHVVVCHPGELDIVSWFGPS